MAKWRNKKMNAQDTLEALRGNDTLIVFDTETTGLTDKAKIIQFSAIRYRIGHDYSLTEDGYLDRYINPQEPLEPIITKLTGITDDVLKGEEPERVRLPEIESFLATSNVWVAYNAAFDVKMLRQMYDRLDVSFQPFCMEDKSARLCEVNVQGGRRVILDALPMARDLISSEKVKNHKLGTVTEFLFPDDDTVFHNALADVGATGKCLEKFLKGYAEALEESEPETTPIYVKKCLFWVNKYQPSCQRIRLELSEGDFGDIYWDVIKREWGHKKTKQAAEIFDRIDRESLESQVMKKHAWRFPGVVNMDQLATEWAKEYRRNH